MTDTLQKLANAVVTHARCLGHHKADRNEALAEKYRRELEAAGAYIPPDSELYKIGKFNGDGSY